MDSTLLKGLEILERVVAGNEPVGISALARELNLPKSNIHRTMTSLREAGYVLYDTDTRHYYPSLKLAQMGDQVTAKFPFRRAVQPELEALVARTGESAHFVYLDGATAVFLASVLPPTSVASVIPEKLNLRWDDTAFGVAIASALPHDQAQILVQSAGVSADAGAMIRSSQEDGFALIRRHATRRIFELAAPIRSGWGTVIGAIGITGPALRFSQGALPDLVQAVRDSARRAFAETDRLSNLQGQSNIGEGTK